MKKLAISIVALSLSAGAAFAENPYIGRTDVIQSGPRAGQPIFDRGTTGSVRESYKAPRIDRNYARPTPRLRGGDAAPYAR